MTRRIAICTLAGLLALLTAACDREPGVPVAADNIDVVAPVPGASTAVAYLDLSNNSGSTITITHVTSPQFGSVSLHETIVENDVARMRPVEGLVIADGETLRLEPGGLHLMLMRPVVDGGTVTLNFHSDGLLILSVAAEMRAASD